MCLCVHTHPHTLFPSAFTPWRLSPGGTITIKQMPADAPFKDYQPLLYILLTLTRDAGTFNGEAFCGARHMARRKYGRVEQLGES